MTFILLELPNHKPTVPLVWQGTALAYLSHIYCASPYIVVSLLSYSIYIFIPFYTSASPFSIQLTPETVNSLVLTSICS